MRKMTMKMMGGDDDGPDCMLMAGGGGGDDRKWKLSAHAHITMIDDDQAGNEWMDGMDGIS